MVVQIDYRYNNSAVAGVIEEGHAIRALELRFPVVFIAVQEYSDNGEIIHCGIPGNPLPSVRTTKPYLIGDHRPLVEGKLCERDKHIFSCRNRGRNILHLVVRFPKTENKSDSKDTVIPFSTVEYDGLCRCCGATSVNVDEKKDFLSQLSTHRLLIQTPIMFTNHLSVKDRKVITALNPHTKIYKLGKLYIIKYFGLLTLEQLKVIRGNLSTAREHLQRIREHLQRIIDSVDVDNMKTPRVTHIKYPY